MFGHEPVFCDAPTPSNIIWEHLDVSEEERTYKTRKAIAIISLVLLGTFLLFTALKTKSGENKVKYSGPAGQCFNIGRRLTDINEYFRHAT